MSILEQLLTQSDEGKKAIRHQTLLVDVSEDIWAEMDRANIGLTELAEKIGTSKSDLSQKLSGRRNVTLRTLSDIADALGFVARVHLEPKVEAWIDAPKVSHARRARAVKPLSNGIIWAGRWDEQKDVA